jgi:2-hydroxychromene-2-carboxylate isomerase
MTADKPSDVSGAIRRDGHDIHFYFDPGCPFSWMTSKWVRLVQKQRSYRVEWRFISLRLVNSTVDYDTQFPANYEARHTSSLRLLRVGARIRAEFGADQIGPFYESIGIRLFETKTEREKRLDRGSREFVNPILAELNLDPALVTALDDESLDAELRRETDEALALTGKDVGTPIIHFQPPDGIAFFGPIISRLPSAAEAAELWDHVIGLASFPGFAELKRSLRERPQLVVFGVEPGTVGIQEDWHGGSRRTKK